MSLHFPRFILFLLLGSAPFISASAASAAEEKPPLSPEFVERLETASNAAEQDKVIASRDPAISEPVFRAEFLRHVYDLVLKGEYQRLRPATANS